jgi:hypothetical protein
VNSSMQNCTSAKLTSVLFQNKIQCIQLYLQTIKEKEATFNINDDICTHELTRTDRTLCEGFS